MSETDVFGLREREWPAANAVAAPLRAVGAPLAVGPDSRMPATLPEDSRRLPPGAPLDRAQSAAPNGVSAGSAIGSANGAANSPSSGSANGAPLSSASTAASLAAAEPSSGFLRAVNAVRNALPIVQRILPLLDGNVGTAVSNILAAQPHAPAPRVDLAPLEKGLSAIEKQHRELRDRVTEQNTALQRVEDRLEMVREATDRNTLEQQELIEDLKGVSDKLKIFAGVAFGLLAISIALNVLLYLHFLQVLPGS